MSFDIKVENLSKTYSISHNAKVNPSMRETIEMAVRNAVNKVTFKSQSRYGDSQKYSQVEEFKALDDVSFEVAPGDRLAIIGKNGAGKSTLLKIMSRITEPTSGSIQIRGRVAALLEVGTGFHPELTGRENIYMNGALLGMPKSEIRKKFDAIVDFSEIDKFLDTPVKYYSSGMYVRLAFSVAAHLDPEVLILDEVLAVGDMRFQQKCLDRMQYASNEGRTVLFVSHNVQSVGQICPKSVLLEGGKVKAIGATPDIVQQYVGASFVDDVEGRSGSLAEYFSDEESEKHSDEATIETGDDQARLISARVLDQDRGVSSTIFYGTSMFIELEYEVVAVDGTYFVPNFHIYSVENVLVFIAAPHNDAVSIYEKGVYKAVCEIPRCLLNEGVYRVTLVLSSWKDAVKIHFLVPNALTFKVVDDFRDISYRNGYMHVIPGMFRPQLAWKVDQLK